MQTAATEILETALALHRAPGERFRLRERPLHPDTIRLIEIAAGVPQALRTAAAELGQPEEVVLEASQFYLEQMLFADPQADAYRLLGVDRDALPETIRRHHRLLQRWLHPDRAHAGDATVFATRVNQAWSQLRSPEARQAHDARLAATAGPAGSEPEAARPIRLWQGEPPEPPIGRHSRWLLGSALVACGVLAVLMYRQQVLEGGPGTGDRGPGGYAVEVAANSTAGNESVETREPAGAGSLQAALAGLLEPATDVLPEPATEVLPEAEALPVAVAVAPAAEIVSPPAPAGVPAGVPVRLVEAALPAPRPVETRTVVPTLAAAAAPAPETSSSQVLAERMRMAEQRLGQVTAYLASSPDAAPMWNDPATAEQAARLRARFGQRAGCPEFDSGVWRLHRDNAHASSAWRCRRERGRLDIELVWREGMWLVRDIALAPAA